MVDAPFEFDGDDWFWLGTGLFIVLVLVVSNVAVGAQVRAATRQGTAFFAGETEALVFNRDQVELINEVSKASIGFSASADERLFCFSVTNNKVTQLRLVDRIEESTFVSVAGACNSRFGGIDGFAHTQPGFSFELSDEDRSLESAVAWTCIVADTVVRSPTGDAGGIKCWKINSGPDFVEVPVRIK